MKVLEKFYNLIIAFACASICDYVYAAPACPDTFCINQPDETCINIRLHGDEWFHWNTTTDNVPIIKNGNGIYEYAIINGGMFVPTGIKAHDLNDRDNTEKEYIFKTVSSKSQNAQLQACIYSAKPKDFQSGAKSIQTPNATGTLRNVTILMQFPDTPCQYGWANFDSLLNDPGYSNYGNHGSVRDYYYDNSCGQLTTISIIAGPYTAQHNLAYYSTGNDIGNSNVRELVQEAVNASKNYVDYSECDNNNDGYVDLVHIVFAGHSAEVGTQDSTIWSHRWVLQNDIVDDGKIIHDYIITPELNSYSGTELTAIGTICHEMGHILGAPDFYDCNPYNGNFNAIGRWDIMSEGNHNNSRHCPAMHNPYTVSQIFHWRDVQDLTSNTSYTLFPIETSATQKYYRLNTPTNGEYFLLENRKKTGWDSSVGYLNDGLLIYHIHKDIATTSSQDINDLHPLDCYIVNSSASTEPNSNPSSYGNLHYAAYPSSSGNKIFFDSSTTPKAQSWAGSAISNGLSYIRKEGSNIIFYVDTKMNGNTILCDSNQYSLSGIPADATISWSYDSTAISQIGEYPVLILSSTNTSSITVYRGTYSIIGLGGILLPPEPYEGAVTLKATVTFNGVQKIFTKSLTLPHDAIPFLPTSSLGTLHVNETRTFTISNGTNFSFGDVLWEITMPQATTPITHYGHSWTTTPTQHGTLQLKLYNVANCVDTLHNTYNVTVSRFLPIDPFDPFLSFPNPVTTGTVDIQVIDKNYATRGNSDKETVVWPGIEYTLELWDNDSHSIRSINSIICGEKDIITLDINNLRNGIYFLTLKVNDEILTTSKMIINH